MKWLSFSIPTLFGDLRAMENGDRFDTMTAQVRTWAEAQQGKLVARLATLTLRDKVAIRKALWNKKNDPNYKPLSKSIGFAVQSPHGVPERVDFRLARHGIFYERGVGRNRKAGSANAAPHPFLKPILDPAIDELADIIMNEFADIAVGEIKFTVPGIISKRIKTG